MARKRPQQPQEPEAQQLTAAASDAAPENAHITAPNPVFPAAPAALLASRPDSHAPTPPKTPAEQGEQAQQAHTHEAGNVPALATDGDTLDPEAAIARVRTRERLMKRDDWEHISRLAKDMRSECNRARMTPEAREAWVWSELDRLYPPVSGPSPISGKFSGNTPETNEKPASTQVADTRVKGLSDLPASWPDLPANASLAVEVAWVQAERLRIVEERPGGATVVTLAKARSPAPSWSALSWLETSIRSYAKFVEVAAKVASAPDDEQAQVKRERMQIEEIRALLREMLE